MQLNFAFKPTAVGEFDEEMLVEYDSGETCYARLTGAAAEVDVALERSLLTLDACYISLVSQSAIRLHNRSDIRVSFSWRQFESAAAEAQAKMVSLANLQLDGGLGASLARQRRRAIELDPLPFSHDVFAIEPSDGEIFPGCYCELTVVFKPETAGDINAVAFCEVNGRDARLPLRLQGKGLGPKATWLYDSLDVGDVFIHSTHRYEVVLENHGEIGTEYGVQARGPLPPPTGLFHSHPTASPPHLSDPHPISYFRCTSRTSPRPTPTARCSASARRAGGSSPSSRFRSRSSSARICSASSPRRSGGRCRGSRSRCRCR